MYIYIYMYLHTYVNIATVIGLKSLVFKFSIAVAVGYRHEIFDPCWCDCLPIGQSLGCTSSKRDMRNAVRAPYMHRQFFILACSHPCWTSQKRLWACERRRCVTFPWNFWRLVGFNNYLYSFQWIDWFIAFNFFVGMSLVPFSLAGVGMLDAGCAYHGLKSMAVDDPCQCIQSLCLHPFRITYVFSKVHNLFRLPAGCISPENGCTHQHGTYVSIRFCSLPETIGNLGFKCSCVSCLLPKAV